MPIYLNEVFLVVAAVLLAGVGGEFFLKGVLAAAHGFRIPNFLVATTLAAFATSSPELTVSTIAAIAGKPEIGLGDALGSNVVNIALIFGLALLIGPIRATRKEFGREFALALLTPLLTLWLAADGLLSRDEGAFLLVIFAAWISFTLHAGLKNRREADENREVIPKWRSIPYLLGGLAALVLAGRLFVTGASGIAAAFGVDAYVIGATVVAIGTSLPELVTVVLARLRGHDDIGVGTLIGSNLFNGLAIVGVAASINPIYIPFPEIMTALVLGSAALVLLLPGKNGDISRKRGVILLVVYIIFLITTLSVGRA